MHGILSMAAVHKAYLIPSQRKSWLALSDYHYTIGSEEFRPHLEGINHDNWAPIMSFATTVALYMCCLPSRSVGSRPEDPIVNVIELLNVMRGTRTMLQPVLPRIKRSQFAPLLIFSTIAEGIDTLVQG